MKPDDERREHERRHEPTSRGTYALVFVALLVLLALTAFADRLDLGAWNTVAAIGIAFAKAILIALFFMHLWGATTIVKAAGLWALFLLGVAFALTTADDQTRGWNEALPSATDRDLAPAAVDRIAPGPEVEPPPVANRLPGRGAPPPDK